MSVSPEELEVIRESLQRIKPDFRIHAVEFYEELFRRAPHLRPMFREDLAGQGMKFMTTLDTIIHSLDEPEAVSARYNELASVHQSLGVRAEHLPPMREALLATLWKALGDFTTPDLEIAWTKAFDDVASRMVPEG